MSATIISPFPFTERDQEKCVDAIMLMHGIVRAGVTPQIDGSLFIVDLDTDQLYQVPPCN